MIPAALLGLVSPAFCLLICAMRDVLSGRSEGGQEDGGGALRVLDVCAAPGSKTLQALDLLSRGAPPDRPVGPPTALRACYAMPGTDAAYGSTAGDRTGSGERHRCPEVIAICGPTLLLAFKIAQP
eukprot:2482748-Rhodomonas_salina.3